MSKFLRTHSEKDSLPIYIDYIHIPQYTPLPMALIEAVHVTSQLIYVTASAILEGKHEQWRTNAMRERLGASLSTYYPRVCSILRPFCTSFELYLEL